MTPRKPLLAMARFDLAGLRPSVLFPGYFALVMGTGVLSIGASLLGLPWLSVALFAVALSAYALLVTLTVIRIARFPASARRDAADPRLAFGPFTFVAGTAVFGVRLSIDGHVVLGIVALGIGLATWSLVGWLALAALRRRPPPEGAVGGSWLLVSVATEALALLAIVLAAQETSGGLAGLAIAMWILGIAAYAVVAVPLLRRLSARPQDARPDVWPLMGVPGLISLVATRMWGSSDLTPLHAVGWLFEPAAIVALVIAYVLTPALLFLQVRVLVRDAGTRRYDPVWWSVVFPTAIAVVGTEALAAVLASRALHDIAAAGFWLVLMVWIVVGTGLVRSLSRPAR